MKNSTKLLSFCFFGRNDNYTPDFLYRLSTTINFLAHSAKIAGRLDALEILIVDWASENRLKDSVSLSVDGIKVANFLYVPSEYTAEYSNRGIPGNICANIALRRAQGKLVGVCGAEVLIPASALTALFNIIDNKSSITDFEQNLYVCGRYRLPIEWVTSKPSIEEWQNYLQLNSWRIQQEPGRGSFLTGNAGLFLIPKKMLHQSQGLLEALDPFWGWNDVEYTMRAISKYSCIDLNSSGVTIYDMEHFQTVGERSKIVKQPAKRLLSQNFCANDENWGGNLLPIESEKASPINTQLIQSVNRRDILNQAELLEEKLNVFALWMADHLVELPNKSELSLLIKLFNIVKNKNVLYYKEFGINQGHSFYLMGFLFKHSTLVGIDHWTMGGGEYGPDHIAYNFTTPVMQHNGHLRLVNQNLLTGKSLPKNNIDNTIKNGLILYRISEDDNVESIISTLNDDINKHDIVLFGPSSHDLGKLIQEKSHRFQFLAAEDNELCVLTQRELKTNFYVQEKLISSMLLFSKIGMNLAEIPMNDLFTQLKSLIGKPIIIWGTSALTELVWPHINENVIGVIGSQTYLDEKYKGKPLIELTDKKLMSGALLVRTF